MLESTFAYSLNSIGTPTLVVEMGVGMPYVVLRHVRPYDTATLNYNWQIWETQAFSLYTTTTTRVDIKSAAESIRGILTFLHKQDIVEYHGHGRHCLFCA